MTRTTAPRLRTTRLDWTRERAFGRISAAGLAGRQAVFTTWEGEQRVGTINGETNEHMPYLRVEFGDGTWARLDSIVRLVVQSA